MAHDSDRDPNLFELVRAGVRLVGWRGALATARYAWWKSRLDRRYLKERPTGPTHRPGSRGEPRREGPAVVVPFGELSLEIVFWGGGLVRTTWTPGRPPAPMAVVQEADPGVAATVEVVAEGDAVRVVADGIAVDVALDGAVTVLADPDRSGGSRTAPEAWAVVRRERPPVWVGHRWTATVELAADDRVHGLGERAARFDLRPGVYGLWNTEVAGSYGPATDPLYLTIPVHLVVAPGRSHLGFWENSHKGGVAIADTMTATFEGGALRTWVAVGSPAQAVGRYLDLTGRPGLPPRWALGYHQCRWGYRTEADVREVLAGFREHDLALSAVHLDIDYMDRYRVFTVDEEDFPDLAGLIADLEADGVRTVTIVDPGVARADDFPLYAEGRRGGRFLALADGTEVNGVVWPGPVGFPDFSDPSVRAWWGDQYRGLVERGVAGIWHDMNEPAVFAAGTEPTLPLATRHHLEGAGGDHVEGRNLYALGMAQAGHDALRRHRPDRRPWLLTRSGWAGIGRYAWTWTGDVGTSWTMVHRTLCTALNLSVSGVAYTGPDIGGFSGDPSPELYARWFQVASWLPFFRSHSVWTMPSREPWNAAGPHLDAVRRAMAWRYRLLPYWYTQSALLADAGDPIVRPVWWPEPTVDEADLLDVDDAFLVGPHVLVAPVLEAGVTTREVLLPTGTWYELEAGRPVAGRVSVEVTMATVPVYVRAGAVLPTDESGTDVLALYPPAGRTVRSWWHRDEGDGYGGRRLDRFDVDSEGPGQWRVRRMVEDEGFAVDDVGLAVRVADGPWELSVDGGPPRSVLDGQPLVVGDWAELALRRPS